MRCHQEAAKECLGTAGQVAKEAKVGERPVRRCYHCDSTNHLVAGCLQKAAQNHKTEVAAVQAYYEGGTEIFAAWEVVNQFTPAEALTWDATNEIFMVTEH